MSRVRKSCFDKLESVKKLIESELPEINVRDLHSILSKLATYHYNKKRYLIVGVERKLYNLLRENSYNPFTVYRWCLLERIPDDRYDLVQGSNSFDFGTIA